MDEKPTQEQIKELWEWCGVFPEKDYSEPPGYVVHYPDIDLNNLFKYAVPKLEHWHIQKTHNEFRGEQVFATVQLGVGKHFSNYWANDPALALFWAIWEVIHAKS